MFKRLFLFLFCLVIGSLISSSTAWSERRIGEITMEFKPLVKSNAKDVRLWIPYPISTRFQEITDMTISGNYSQHAIYSDGINGNIILFAGWNMINEAPELTLRFKASRDEVVKNDFPEKEGKWSRSDYSDYLKSYRLSPLNLQVRELSGRITSGKTTMLTKAKAVYDWVVENMYRDPSVKGCGDGDVCRLLKSRKGKCTDINSVFVALARAADVPSREVFGIRLGKDSENDITREQHCWAEFYLPGYGWVPVDPADVRKRMLVKNLDLDDEKTKEYCEYFFGAIDPYRIQLSVGRDIVLCPPQKAGPLNYFMYPYMEIDGKPVSSLSPDTFRYRFTFREILRPSLFQGFGDSILKKQEK